MNTSLLTFALLLAAASSTTTKNPIPETRSLETQPTETAAPAPGQPGEALPPPAAQAADTTPSASAKAPGQEAVEEVVNLVESDPTAGWYGGDSYPEHERVLAMPTARALRKGSWAFILDHRAKQPFHSEGDPWRKSFFDFGGLDQGLTVGLSLRYGILEGLDVGIYRAGQQPGTRTDTYEFDARYQPLRQEKAGVDLAVRVGATWFAQYNAADASGLLGQILVDRVLFNRLLIGGGVLYHSSSSNGAKYSNSKKYSVAAAAFAELRVAAPVAISLEVLPAVAGYHSKYPSYSAGVKYLTTRHTFAFALGNTTFLTSDGYITNSPSGLRDTTIGFNITREY
jgi:hypothetical protein